MKPNLARIPGDRDAFAWAILARTPRPVDPAFLGSLDPSVALALGQYGARLATIALRENSVALLRRSLLATGLARCLQDDDDRDVMIGLALPWVVAQQLGESPAAVFESIADGLPECHTSRLLRTFGARQDITP